MTSRRAFLSSLASAGLLRGQGRRRPNILFVFSDDHAYQAISAYGSVLNRTPNIDRIAREGVRFDNAVVTNSICGPSRAVILTGKYSHLNGFKDNRSKFDGTQQTFPKLLQAAGYQTAIFGKWHLVTTRPASPTGKCCRDKAATTIPISSSPRAAAGTKGMSRRSPRTFRSIG